MNPFKWIFKTRKKTHKQDLVFAYGDLVRIREGFYRGLSGRCVSLDMGDIMVNLDKVGHRHFHPSNLEKVNE